MTPSSVRTLIGLVSSACLTAACLAAEPSAAAPPPNEPLPPTATPFIVPVWIAPTLRPSSTPRPPSTPTPDDGTIHIHVGDNYFEPDAITVTVGSTVRWIAVGSAAHSILVGGPTVWRGTLDGAGSRPSDLTFSLPGTYPYMCDLHPGSMQGVIIVIEGN
jgi:plastocyanin